MTASTHALLCSARTWQKQSAVTCYWQSYHWKIRRGMDFRNACQRMCGYPATSFDLGLDNLRIFESQTIACSTVQGSGVRGFLSGFYPKGIIYRLLRGKPCNSRDSQHFSKIPETPSNSDNPRHTHRYFPWSLFMTLVSFNLHKESPLPSLG